MIKHIKTALSLDRPNSYLYDKGWFKSREKKLPIDKDGNPIPWLTYSFMDFITARLKKSFSLFEYGCGNSTLFFARHVKKITSVEHNKKWFEQIEPKSPNNSELHFRTAENYVDSIADFEKEYDLILIDGILRNKCITKCVSFLKEDGVIILDNSNRTEKYLEGTDFLAINGFKRIDFLGYGSWRKERGLYNSFLQKRKLYRYIISIG